MHKYVEYVWRIKNEQLLCKWFKDSTSCIEQNRNPNINPRPKLFLFKAQQAADKE